MEELLIQKAERNDCLFTRADALDAGCRPAAIRGRLANADWVEVQPRVYRHAVAPFSVRARLRAPGLSSPSVFLSHESAAAWLGIRETAPDLSWRSRSPAVEVPGCVT